MGTAGKDWESETILFVVVLLSQHFCLSPSSWQGLECWFLEELVTKTALLLSFIFCVSFNPGHNDDSFFLWLPRSARLKNPKEPKDSGTKKQKATPRTRKQKNKDFVAVKEIGVPKINSSQWQPGTQWRHRDKRWVVFVFSICLPISSRIAREKNRNTSKETEQR